MNKIEKDEMFGNLKEFLKSKGIELQESDYTKRIRQGCGILADSINLSQQAFERAKAAVDEGLDHLRRTIREQTAARDQSTGNQKSGPKRAAGKSSGKKPGASSRGRRH